MENQKMKAVICTKYGSPDVLELQEIDIPQPKDNEILVKIMASSVTAADGMMRKGTPFYGRFFMGLMKPKYPVTGTGFAGEVIAIGSSVLHYRVGDQVFGESIFGAGTNAEYLTVPEDGILAKKPENMTFEEVASIADGPLTSLNFLKDKAQIKAGQKVLINGASGSLGTAAVQLAKHFGAEITGVCSTRNVELVKSLGADHVIDYTKIDFTETGETYDIIYDTVGKSNFAKAKQALTPRGKYLSPVLSLRLLFQVLLSSFRNGKKAIFDATGMRPQNELRVLLHELKDLLELGKLKSVIDRYYTLDQINMAHAYVDTGHKKGNVVIRVNNGH